MTKTELLTQLSNEYTLVGTETVERTEDYGGITVTLWRVPVIKVVENVGKQTLVYFYTDPSDNAYWQNSEPFCISDTFGQRVQAFVESKVDDATIKFGFLVQVNDATKKALASVILPDNSTREVLIEEDINGDFSLTIL